MAGELREVGVPQLNGGTSPLPGVDGRSVFTRPPSGQTPSSILGDINYRGLEEFGRGLSNITDRVIIPELNRQAAEEGANAVARDPATGELTVIGGFHSNLLPWGRAYNDAAKKSFVIQTDAALQTDVQTIFQNNPDDPQAARLLADKSIKATAAKAPPEIRADIILNGTQHAEQYLRGAMLDKTNRETKKFIGTVLSKIDDEMATYVSLAATPGGASTPEFVQSRMRLQQLYYSLADNPLTGYTPEMADHEISAIDKRAKAESILSHMQYGGEGLYTVQSALGLRSAGDRNLANNNPGNMRVPGGQKAFQTFPSMQEGINAVGQQIGRYLSRGKDTIQEIVSTYAPSSENNTSAYIAKVAELTGKAPTEKLTTTDIPAIRDAMITVEQGKSPQQILSGQPNGTGGMGTEEAKAQIRALNLPPDEAVTMINRAEGVQRDRETQRRQALEDNQRILNLVSESHLKQFFEDATAGKLTVSKVLQLAPELNAADLHAGLALARGAGLEDDSQSVVDLTLALDHTPPDAFKARAADMVQKGLIKPETMISLIGKNESQMSGEGGPASPYKQGRAFVKDSLDVNPFGAGNDYGAKKRAQANALTEYDAWAEAHPDATPKDALAEAGSLVHRYDYISSAVSPQAIGSPFGFSGVLSAVTKKDVVQSAQRLKANKDKMSPAQYQNEAARLRSWIDFLERREAPKPKVTP